MSFAPSYRVSLRAKVILLVTIIFAIIAGQTTVKAFLNFRTIKQDKLAEFQSTARWIESEQRRHIAQARLISFIAMDQVRSGLKPDICLRGISGSPGLDPELGRFAIADSNGKIFCNSIPWLKLENVADKGYFQSALRLADTTIIAEEDNQNPSQYAALMARSMHDDRHVQAVILVAMDFSWVKEEIDIAHLPPDGHLILIDTKGKVIAGSPNVADLIDKSIADTAFYKRIADKPDSSAISNGYGGEPSVVVAHEINTGAGNFLLVIDTPTRVLLQPAYSNLIRNLLFSFSVFILLLVLTYSWSNRYLLRKISALDLATNKLADGELGTRVNALGDDELGNLAISFNVMAESLQAKGDLLKEANNELFRSNRALRVLSAGNRTLLLAKTEQELLERLCREIVEEGGYIASWVIFAGSGQDKYLLTRASYPPSDGENPQMDWNSTDDVIAAVRENKVIVVNDTSDTACKFLGQQAASLGIGSFIVLPLHQDNKPIGAIILAAYRNNEFGPAQVGYLKETAADTSFGMELMRTKADRDRLALLSEHHEAMLRKGLEEALMSIAITIEMRDPYTAGHQRRVAELSVALARELGISEDEIHGIYLAAIVHDVGKINVPAEILVRPGKLGEMEYPLVKSHVTKSYEILKGIHFSWPIAEMVYQHHERLDGSGYPRGLKDGQILFGARILAVADVVESMSSHRPYRPALGIEAALAEIKKGKGTLYDETVADACSRLFRDGRFEF